MLLTGLIPAAVGAALLSDGDFEYLGILNQKGTQIITGIVQREDALNRNSVDRSEVASAYCLEKLKNDVGLLTLEGDHLQSLAAIARRMVDSKDEEIAMIFARTTAEASLRKVQLLRDDVGTITGMCPTGTGTPDNVKQVLSFMDEFANVVDLIARRIK
jgi:hypothetical protein